MGTLIFVVECLADIMQQSGSLGQLDVQSQLACHQTRELRDLDGMLEYILPVGGSVFESAQNLDQLRMQIVNADLEGRLFAFLLDDRVDFLGRLFDHFLDPRRMDAAVYNELFERDTRDLSSDRIEAGQDDRLRCVVDDQIYAGERFDGSDVAALSADDASLHFIIRERDHRNGGFSHMIRRAALNRAGDDVFRLLIRFFLCLGFDLFDHHRGFVTDFLFGIGEQDGLRLLCRIT